MVEYMYENPKLANDEFNLKDKKDKYVYDRLWSELHESLNNDGPPWHTTVEWKDVSIINSWAHLEFLIILLFFLSVMGEEEENNYEKGFFKQEILL